MKTATNIEYTQRQTNERRQDLQRAIADRAAMSEIECFCTRRYDTTQGAYWYDTASADRYSREWIDQAVEYLNLRHLIERDGSEVRLLVNVAEVA